VTSRLAPVLAALLAGLAVSTRVDAGERWAAWEKAIAAHPLRDARGNVVRVADLKGEVVVVSFWASWCKPCKKELTALDGWLAAAHGSTAAPRVLAVSVDQDPRKAARFVQDAALRLPVYVDGPDGLAQALDLPSLPLTLVLDRDGHIAQVAEKGTPEELARVESTVRALLSEAPPARVPAAEEQKENGEREGQG